MNNILLLSIGTFLSKLSFTQPGNERGLLKVTDNGHYLQYDLNPEQPNDTYFQLVDPVIAISNDKDMIITLLPAWGDKMTAKYGGGLC